MTNKVKSSNFSQALWLGIGQLGTFAFTFISAAILARYLPKEDYGTYKQILYVYATMMSIFTVGLPGVFSYFIPRLNANQQKTLVNSLNRIFLLLGALFSISLYLLSSPIADLLKNPDLAVSLKIFSPFPLFTLPTLGVEGIYTALRKTKQVALYHVISRSIMVLSIVLPIVLYKPDYKVAIVGWGVASFLTFLVAMYMKSKPYVKVEKELIPNMYKAIFDYSLPLMGAFIAGFFISSADQFFISRYYGVEAFADYSNGSLSIPIVAVIAISVKKVLLPIFSKADNEGTMDAAYKVYENAVNKSVLIVFPILIFAFLFAKEILVFIYGEQYASSETYMRYYLIRDFVEILPYFAVLLAIGRSKVYMYMHIAGAIYVWILNFILIDMGLGPTIVVAVATSFHILNRVFGIIYIYFKTKLNLFSKSVAKNMLIVLLHASVCGLLTYFVKYIYMEDLQPFFVIIISGIIFYLILVLSGLAIKINYLESVKTLLNRKKIV